MSHIEMKSCGTRVTILDQTLLPNEERYIDLETPEEMYLAIKNLQVRGAPAIGIFAGYALAALGRQMCKPKSINSCCGANIPSDEVFINQLKDYGEYLKSSRPTAVNLAWAVDRIIKIANIEKYRARAEQPGIITANAGFKRLADAIEKEAREIHEEDKAMCRMIAEFGLQEMKRLQTDNEIFGVLTHCNAGPLATSEYGTALGPLLLAAELGGIPKDNGSTTKFRVFADETRPLLQGARLTTYELDKAGIDVTLICDNMASMVMKNGWVQACFVGCDRVAANGDVANKIGTSGVAILAKHYGIPFYVLGPTSTIDMECPSGLEIPIEERDQEEIKTKFYKRAMAPRNVKCYNPAFDVTDNKLISGIITEKGVIRPPYKESIIDIMRAK